MLGVQFGVSESTAHNLFHYWSKILRELLPASLLEQVKKNDWDWEWVKEMLGEWELVVDSSEQARERPCIVSGAEKVLLRKEEKPYPKKSVNCLAKRSRNCRCNRRTTRDK
jgi:hypothetical protein